MRKQAQSGRVTRSHSSESCTCPTDHAHPMRGAPRFRLSPLTFALFSASCSFCLLSEEAGSWGPCKAVPRQGSWRRAQEARAAGWLPLPLRRAFCSFGSPEGGGRRPGGFGVAFQGARCSFPGVRAFGSLVKAVDLFPDVTHSEVRALPAPARQPC